MIEFVTIELQSRPLFHGNNRPPRSLPIYRFRHPPIAICQATKAPMDPQLKSQPAGTIHRGVRHVPVFLAMRRQGAIAGPPSSSPSGTAPATQRNLRYKPCPEAAGRWTEASDRTIRPVLACRQVWQTRVGMECKLRHRTLPDVLASCKAIAELLIR
jgi:hypothetical protein